MFLLLVHAFTVRYSGVEGRTLITDITREWGPVNVGTCVGAPKNEKCSDMRTLDLDENTVIILDCFERSKKQWTSKFSRAIYIRGLKDFSKAFVYNGSPDLSNVECAFNSDFSNSVRGRECFWKNDASHMYWNGPGKGHGWALYKGNPGTLRHCDTKYGLSKGRIYIIDSTGSSVSFSRLKHGKECQSRDKHLGRLPTVRACAKAVRDYSSSAMFFVYGIRHKARHCYIEFTKSADCPEGWENDSYDFYELNGDWTPTVVVEVTGMGSTVNDLTEYQCGSGKHVVRQTRAHGTNSNCEARDTCEIRVDSDCHVSVWMRDRCRSVRHRYRWSNSIAVGHTTRSGNCKLKVAHKRNNPNDKKGHRREYAVKGRCRSSPQKTLKASTLEKCSRRLFRKGYIFSSYNSHQRLCHGFYKCHKRHNLIGKHHWVTTWANWREV